MDVEVTDEEATTSTSNLSLRHLSSGRRDGHRHHTRDQKLQKAASIAQEDLERVERAGKNIEEWVKGKVSPNRRKDIIPIPSSPSNISEPNGNDDDEEGWASETSDSGELTAGASSSAGSSVTAKAEGKKRSRGFGIGRKGRQRVSLRRSIAAGHVKRHADESDDGEESRGRSGAAGTSRSHLTVPYPGMGSRRDSAINQRLQSIRAQASRSPMREASPSRSVRFVDGGTLSARASRVWGDVPPPPPTSPRAIETPPSPSGLEKAESSGSSNGSASGGRG